MAKRIRYWGVATVGGVNLVFPVYADRDAYDEAVASYPTTRRGWQSALEHTGRLNRTLAS